MGEEVSKGASVGVGDALLSIGLASSYVMLGVEGELETFEDDVVGAFVGNEEDAAVDEVENIVSLEVRMGKVAVVVAKVDKEAEGVTATGVSTAIAKRYQ